LTGCQHTSAGLCMYDFVVGFFVIFSCSIYIFVCFVLELHVVNIATCMLTSPHKSPAVQGSTAQRIDGYKC
jgi:hypothetical protein